ncbi:hypothetical protein Tco_1401575 [Tanacetum coccineum]
MRCFWNLCEDDIVRGDESRGDGNVASVWFDRWCALSQLASLISNRDINRASFHSSSKVVDVSDVDSWNCPIEWQDKYPMACSLIVPILDPSSRDLLIWEHMKMFAGLPNCSSSLEDIVTFLVPISKKCSARSVIAKLVFVACSYFIWQERNYRLFKKRERSKEQVLELIMSIVCLKLLSCRFKKTSRVDSLARTWNIPRSLIRDY